MNRSTDILNELNEISPLLAGIGNKNVLVVPDNYFDNLDKLVMVCVNENNHSLPAECEPGVPEGYFEGLTGNILGKIKGTVANELQEISPLLGGVKKDNLFTVPAFYFEQLPGDVLSKLDVEEVSGVLEQVKKLQPFTVPDGYFENLGDEILEKIQHRAVSKVITMPKRRNLLLKLAAAAVFTGALVLGSYKYLNTTNHITESASAAGLAPVIEQGIAIASDDKKFDETLGNLDEEDIAQYLEKNGSESDMAMLTSSLDESNLPDQDDYLTDEKTLDNFIETINAKN